MKRKKGFMDFNLYCQMLDLNRNISSIQLMNWGEPLLHPKIFEMIDYAKNKGLVVRIVTNGTILNDEKVKKLLDSNLDCLCISVDGATKKTYEKVRNYNYDKLEKTIKNLVKTRDVLKKHTFIEVSMVIFEETEKEIEAFRRKWFQVVDRVQIQPKMSSQNIKRTKKCFELWRGNPIILWDGTIVPCCVDAEGELGVGNIKHEKSLSKILNSDKMVKLRQGHIHNKFPTLCAFCNEYDSKKTSKRFQ